MPTATRHHFNRDETARLVERFAHEPDTTEVLYGFRGTPQPLRPKQQQDQDRHRESKRDERTPQPHPKDELDVSAFAEELLNDEEPDREERHEEADERKPYPAETQGLTRLALSGRSAPPRPRVTVKRRRRPLRPPDAAD